MRLVIHLFDLTDHAHPQAFLSSSRNGEMEVSCFQPMFLDRNADFNSQTSISPSNLNMVYKLTLRYSRTIPLADVVDCECKYYPFHSVLTSHTY